MPRLLLILTIAAALAVPRGLRAGATSPTLVVSSATAAAVNGVRSVALEGMFDFDNAVQTGYALQFLVFQGTTFVRFPVADPPRTGTSPLVADGDVTEGDFASLAGAGQAAPAETRIVSLTSRSARLVLPPSFTAGPATVMIATILPNDDDAVLSNPLPFVLP
jgi:hypothetical protein